MLALLAHTGLLKNLTIVIDNDTVGAVVEEPTAAYRGFDPRKEQIFLWLTCSCSRSGCFYT